MTHRHTYIASILLMVLFWLPAAADNPDSSKAVWAFHNGAGSPYATFDDLHHALWDTEGIPGYNIDLQANDILELHADTHEPDLSVNGQPYVNYVGQDITIRSAEGGKYKVYSPQMEGMNIYFWLGNGASMTVENVVLDNSRFPNSPHLVEVINHGAELTLLNVDVIGGGTISTNMVSNVSATSCRFKDCSFSDMQNGVLSMGNAYGLGGYGDELTMDGCTIDNCGCAISINGDSETVLNDIKISNCSTCFHMSGDATCEINGDETLISGNAMVTSLDWNASLTINGGTFSDNHTTGSDAVFHLANESTTPVHSTTMIINGGSFIGNSTEEGGVIQQYLTGNLQLHGGYFEGNNVDRKGEVLTFPTYQQYVSGTGYVNRYAEVDFSGAPVFGDGQYVYLEKWMDADKIGGYEHDQYDLVQHLVKDGVISPDAHINVSTEFGNGFHGTQELDILVPSEGTSVLDRDMSAFNVSYTDIYEDGNPMTCNIEFGESQLRNGKRVIKFTNYTTITITRYGLQENDSAIFNIYHESSPGNWELVHRVSLTGKATGTYVRREIHLSKMGRFKIVETDFNFKYAKEGTMINGTVCSTEGEGIASGPKITFEVHGDKEHHEGTEKIKQNIFKWRDVEIVD